MSGLRGWSGGVVSLILALTVLALGGTLLLVEQRVNGLREQVGDVGEPAGDLLAEVQYLLARQTSALRGYLISEDSTYLARYDSLRLIEQEIHPRLERYAARLSPMIAAEVAELIVLSEQWHSRIEIPEIETVGSAELDADAPVVLFEQRLYTATLEAASRAMAAVRQAVRAWEAEIERVERNGRFGLSALFLLAGLVAIWSTVLNARIRSLALETEARRVDAERAMDRTEQMVAQREYLIRGFTHDVKNPLNVAVGYAELLELGHKGELESQQVRTVGRIRTAIHGAVEIIDTLLEINRMESDGLKIKREPVDLRALARDVTRQLSTASEAAGLELAFIDGADATEAVTAITDAHRVRQVLTNLVTNALKFTPPPGQVTVGVDASPADAGRPGTWARLSVIDTGPGIPLDEQERIFYEFHRVPGSTAPGHGLGLASSRGIGRLLGGDVTVESVPGQGTTFVLWLPR
jgi:signal transduction histidine kinase